MVPNLFSFIPGFGRSNEITQEAADLAKMWPDRLKAMQDWYDLLKLEDKLAQTDMESFVSNDPRTTYNMGVYLLQPRPLVVKIEAADGSVLSPNAKIAATVISQYIQMLWKDLDRAEANRGRQSWFWSFVGLLVTTGWYATPYWPNLFVDYWNPATVYPEFSEDRDVGLLRVARIRKLSVNQAKRTIMREGYRDIRLSNSGWITEVQIWRKEDTGVITHAVAMGNELVKPRSIEPTVSDIPILVGAVGGLPDMGVLDKQWSANVGQSILATNAPIHKNFNKQQTYIQQLIRDTANARVQVRTTSSKRVVDPDSWYKRGGAFYQIGPNDSIDIIGMPAIPVELTMHLRTLQSQLAKGGFSDVTFGNIMQKVSSLVISQASEAAMQLITPFKNAIVYVTDKISDIWYQAMLNNAALRPKSLERLENFPLEELRSTCAHTTYQVKIPGDLANRINMARMLNKDFELPFEMVTDLLFQEVTNPVEAQAKLLGEKAKKHESFQIGALIEAYGDAAREARQAGNNEMASFWDSMANRLRSMATSQPSPEQKLGNAQVQTGAEAEPTGALPSNISPVQQARLGGTIPGGRENGNR